MPAVSTVIKVDVGKCKISKTACCSRSRSRSRDSELLLTLSKRPELIDALLDLLGAGRRAHLAAGKERGGLAGRGAGGAERGGSDVAEHCEANETPKR